MPIVTITVEHDGYAYYDSLIGWGKSAVTNDLMIGFYEGKVSWSTERIYLRFSLALLPSGSTVTQVRLKVRVNTAGGAAFLTDVHAYDTNGQTDPEPDPALTTYNRCASGNLYYDDGTDFRTAGIKWITLGGTVCVDVQNAKAAVNRFALGLHEEGDNDPSAMLDALEKAGGVPAQLEITYTPPPVVWGGSALPQVQMAKAILGL